MGSKSIAATLIALLVCAFVGTATVAAQPATVTMSATVNGQDVGAASAADPLRLQPGESVEVAVEVANNGTEAVEVRRVELSGRVVGLTFFNYATAVQLTVEPGATDTLRYRLDLFGLEGQATGLIGGELSVADAAGDTVASIPTVTDVRGSLISVYGLFGIALVVLTALALLDAALAVAKHRLSENRWQRGLRLLAPGVGIGLVVAFSASVARLWVPSTGLWLVLAGLTAAVFFTLGYFSPTPQGEEEEDEELDEDEDLDADTMQAPTDEFGR
ncbi:hypothetical protein [Mycobacterium hubeiense]|uniref:hypothetical protein n=1 Tax=Mycobacterium hubeiense TaxID=1867256 RepID=UPI000C7F66C2|nr:hypothetical protein [Mycobacterium sp. QGD 101]